MAQKDYVSRGRSTGTRRKTNSRSKKRSGSSGISKFMIVLAVAVLVTFVGGLWFIAHHKKEDTPVITDHKAIGNVLPPKPEERWRYIKELENRQIGVPTPTEPSSGGEVHMQTQLTNEQRQLLEQMQADMRQQPTQLNEVPWNEQTPAQRQQTIQRQNQLQQQSRMQQQVQQQQPVRTQQTQPVQTYQQPTRTQQTQPVQTYQQPTRTQSAQQNPQQTERAAPQQTHTQQRPAPVTSVTREPTRQQEVAAQPKAETKPKEAEKEKSQRWMVQCGSFKGTDQAESVRAALAFEGFESRITTGGGWNRVVIGPYSNRAGADSALKNLRGSGHSNCIPLAIGG
ncbi:cell division protein FtsN [Erwiniaceae bacterium CAU 1747]